MLAKLEKYSSNLEEIVAHRTKQLMEEKQKTDMLLYRMLPSCVRLVSCHHAESRNYEIRPNFIFYAQFTTIAW